MLNARGLGCYCGLGYGLRLGGLAAILGMSVVCGGLLHSMIGAGGLAGSLETSRATSTICIPFLLGTPFGVFTKYELGGLSSG